MGTTIEGQTIELRHAIALTRRAFAASSPRLVAGAVPVEARSHDAGREVSSFALAVYPDPFDGQTLSFQGEVRVPENSADLGKVLVCGGLAAAAIGGAIWYRASRSHPAESTDVDGVTAE
jgi:hypothetical protein